eukprot:Hpha_TRINITY_DN14867_c3_g1::TRINITY_DN14867_c3_g1_i1::g.168965::m.168965
MVLPQPNAAGWDPLVEWQVATGAVVPASGSELWRLARSLGREKPKRPRKPKSPYAALSGARPRRPKRPAPRLGYAPAPPAPILGPPLAICPAPHRLVLTPHPPFAPPVGLDDTLKESPVFRPLEIEFIPSPPPSPPPPYQECLAIAAPPAQQPCTGTLQAATENADRCGQAQMYAFLGEPSLQDTIRSERRARRALAHGEAASREALRSSLGASAVSVVVAQLRRRRSQTKPQRRALSEPALSVGPSSRSPTPPTPPSARAQRRQTCGSHVMKRRSSLVPPRAKTSVSANILDDTSPTFELTPVRARAARRKAADNVIALAAGIAASVVARKVTPVLSAGIAASVVARKVTPVLSAGIAASV